MLRVSGNPYCCVVLGLCVIFGVFLSVDTHNVSSSRRSGYNEACNKTVKCRSQAWLGCDSTTGLCGCVKADEMTYDTTKEKCVALLGERCKFGFDGDEERSLWYEKAECVQGGVCGPSGICSCPSGTYEDSNQTACHLVKGYGKECSRKVECNQNKFLSCVKGNCSCDPDAAIYSATAYSYYDNNYGTTTVPADICVGRVGSSCSREAKKYCISNAICNRQSSVCQCSGTFTPTSDLLCGLGYNEACSSSGSSSGVGGAVCSDQLVCSGDAKQSSDNRTAAISSRCKCPNPEFQEYDTTEKYCRGRVGSPCNPSEMKSCTRKASCVESHGVFQCECNKGYVVTKFWRCQKAYGQTCVYGSNGNFVYSEESCDDVPSLKCLNGSCSCPNAIDVYEVERRRCSTPEGFACKETSECGMNAECKPDPAGDYFPGRCVCKNGFDVFRNRTCGVEVEAASSNSSEVPGGD